MWIKLDLDGMRVEFEIDNYKANQNLDGNWTNFSYNYSFRDIIKYNFQNAEILLSCEIDELRDVLEKLLNDELTDIKKINFIEPDLEFELHPKFDIRNDSNLMCVKSEKEKVDIYMELKVNLWDGGLTSNYFSTTFSRNEIEYLFVYLSLITKKISKDDSRVLKLIENGILYGNI